jgi:hypothetical protein
MEIKVKENDGKTLTTVKEFAEVMGVDETTITHHIRELYPDKMKAGVKTYLTNQEMIEVKAKMIRTQGKLNGPRIKFVGELNNPQIKFVGETNLQIALMAN